MAGKTHCCPDACAERKEGCTCRKRTNTSRRLVVCFASIFEAALSEGWAAMLLCRSGRLLLSWLGSSCRKPDCLICSHSFAVRPLLLLLVLLVALLLLLVPAATGGKAATACASSLTAMKCGAVAAGQVRGADN